MTFRKLSSGWRVSGGQCGEPVRLAVASRDSGAGVFDAPSAERAVRDRRREHYLRPVDAGVPTAGGSSAASASGEGQHNAAPPSGSAKVLGGRSGTGADASGRDPAVQVAPEGTRAAACVHERMRGADNEQRVGAGVANERGLPQSDERVPGIAARRRADGGGHGPPARIPRAVRVAQDAEDGSILAPSPALSA